MANSVFIIDQNPAVQALAAAALHPLSVTVRCFAAVAEAVSALPSLVPAVVFCAEELDGENALTIWRAIKESTLPAPPKFVILSSGRNSRMEKEAHGQGVAAVLAKPFKAAQLRQLVEQLAPEARGRRAALVVRDSFTKEAVRTFLEQRGVECESFDSGKSLAESRSNFSVVVSDAGGELSWWTPALGQLVVISDEPSEALPPGAHLLTPPLSVAGFTNAFACFLPGTDPAEDVLRRKALDTREQALLAARISALIYEKLLTQEALKHGRWEEAAAQTGAIALKICRDYEQPKK